MISTAHLQPATVNTLPVLGTNYKNSYLEFLRRDVVPPYKHDKSKKKKKSLKGLEIIYENPSMEVLLIILKSLEESQNHLQNTRKA
jgi:hypothetical protein